MSADFYPFTADGNTGADVDAPTSAARIAVYDDMTMVPRVVVIEPADVRTYLEQITAKVFELATQAGGSWSFMLIRELVENFIHAHFIEPTISILDHGQTISFSDQGPGIANKDAALRPSYSSATPAMKRYIRGVGSGLPIVEEQIKLKGGSISISDNLGGGTIVTISLVQKEQAQPVSQHPGCQQAPQVPRYQQSSPYPQDSPYQNPPQGLPYQQGSQYQDQPQGSPFPNQAQPPAFPTQPQVMGYYPQPYPQQSYQAFQSSTYEQRPQAPQGWNQPYPGAPYPYAMDARRDPIPQPQAYPPVSQPWGQQADQASTQMKAEQDGAANLVAEDMAILGLFMRYEKLGPKELNTELGLSNATASRRLKELAGTGTITKHGQKYVPTPYGNTIIGYMRKAQG